MPVFSINFGEMGFLATVDREDAESGCMRALAGDFEVLSLPAIKVLGDGGRWLGINDVSIHRQHGNRVADLEYAVNGDEVGRVRWDGIVVATPAGSTGYNLANGGPVMAWGVHGFVVSFISPHSLTARTLVVAPDDRVLVYNRSREEPVEVDRRRAADLRARAGGAPRGAVRQRSGSAGSDPGDELLPAPATEVRADGHLALPQRSVGRGW